MRLPHSKGALLLVYANTQCSHRKATSAPQKAIIAYTLNKRLFIDTGSGAGLDQFRIPLLSGPERTKRQNHCARLRPSGESAPTREALRLQRGSISQVTESVEA